MNESDIEHEIQMINPCIDPHENIVHVYDHGLLRPTQLWYYIDMELCDFHLGQYMRNEITGIQGLLEWPSVVNEGHLLFLLCPIMQQIIKGLVFIHSKGNTHGDLSPQNGILNPQFKGGRLTLGSVIF